MEGGRHREDRLLVKPQGLYQLLSPLVVVFSLEGNDGLQPLVVETLAMLDALIR